MSGNSTTTNAPYPPGSTQIGASQTGTITAIACTGPCIATIYSAAGVALHSINSPLGVKEAVSIAWTGGPPYVSQQTPSAITVTY